MPETEVTNAAEVAEAESDQDSEIFLNCSEFKLMEIALKGDRAYRLSFQADDLSGHMEHHLAPESPEETPFEKAVDMLSQTLFNSIFPDASLVLKKMKRKIVNNKNKEPQDLLVISAERLISPGYTIISQPLRWQTINPAIKQQFEKIEELAKEEITKKREQDGVQGSLFE